MCAYAYTVPMHVCVCVCVFENVVGQKEMQDVKYLLNKFYSFNNTTGTLSLSSVEFLCALQAVSGHLYHFCLQLQPRFCVIFLISITIVTTGFLYCATLLNNYFCRHIIRVPMIMPITICVF